MSQSEEKFKNTATRRVRVNSGVSGLTIELSLIHLYNISMLCDMAKKFMKVEHKEEPAAVELITKMTDVLGFIVQGDFPHPMAEDLWKYDDEPLRPTKESYR